MAGEKVEKKKEVKQKYELTTIEEYINKVGNVDEKGNTISVKDKLNLAFNMMLDGKKIVGTTERKGLNYFIVEKE